MTIRIAAIGLDHGHIHGQVDILTEAGAELAGFATDHADQAAEFVARHPDAVQRPAAELLSDPKIQVIVSAAVPLERAEIAIAAMEAGKDALLDKPGVTSFDALRRLKEVQARTGRIVKVLYSELECNQAALTALRLVRTGRIGRLVHYAGFGPHRIKGNPRPGWFWDAARNGGLLNDIASHQIAQFLIFAGQSRGRITAARSSSTGAHPGFDDLGDFMIETEGATGYVRVDWLTPDGLPVWGDGRIFLTGTHGTIELRKYVDPAGQGVGPHLILTDANGVERIDCAEARSEFGTSFLADVEDRTETAMAQDFAFHLMELSVTAQSLADEKKHKLEAAQ